MRRAGRGVVRAAVSGAAVTGALRPVAALAQPVSYAVVAGAVLHYHASLVLLRWRDHQSCVVDDHMLFPFYLTQ